MLEDKPYILCPELSEFGVVTTPLWFKPKGREQGAPVIQLELVPPAFFHKLEIQGFRELSQGWLIDCTYLDENFWREIFGHRIGFVKRKPVKQYEPKRIEFYPAPAEVKVVVANFSDEHVAGLTKNAGVIGLDAIRACKKDAMRGAVTCRGVWPIIKAACLERLEKNPEDIKTFEYVWATAKAASLDTTDLPSHISFKSLLAKIIERGRLTAAMDAVIPRYFRMKGVTPFIIKADWETLIAYQGGSKAGPIDITHFSHVVAMAQYLLEEGSESLSHDATIAHFKSRIEQSISEQPAFTDWVDELEMPELGDQTPEGLLVPGEGVDNCPIQDTPISTTVSPNMVMLSWHEVYIRLTELNQLIEGRVPYCRCLCRKIAQLVLRGKANIRDSNFFECLDEILGCFSSVINDETLEKAFDHNQGRLGGLASRVTNGVPAAKNELLKVLRSYEAAKDLITKKLAESHGEGMRWWWDGFNFSNTGNGNCWLIFQSQGSKARQYSPIEFPSMETASEALRYMVRRSRMKCMREGLSGKWFHGYCCLSGSILELSKRRFESESDALFALRQTEDNYLTDVRLPVLWLPDHRVLGLDEAQSLSKELMTICGLHETFYDLDGRFRFVNSQGQLMVETAGRKLAEPVERGRISHIWAGALYDFLQTEYPEWVKPVLWTMISTKSSSELDIEIEEELLEELGEHRDIIEDVFGGNIFPLLEQAITNPSAEYVDRCLDLVYRSNQSPMLGHLHSTLRSVLLAACQHRSRHVITHEYRAKMEAGLSRKMLFQYVFAQFVWQKISWAGSKNPSLVVCGMAGDSPSVELYPEWGRWIVHREMQKLMDALLNLPLP